MPSVPETVPASSDANIPSRQPLHAVNDVAPAVVVVEAAAERPGVGAGLEDVALLEPRDHQDRDRRGDDARR